MNKISKAIITCFKRGNIVFFAGNGGSASQANHFAAEFVVKCETDHQPLNAISLAANQSIITAIANDYGYNYIFSRQIAANGHKNDLLLLLSTSGKSENIIYAAAQAKLMGIKVIHFPRKGSSVTQIQNNQLALMHEICLEVEQEFLT